MLDDVVLVTQADGHLAEMVHARPLHGHTLADDKHAMQATIGDHVCGRHPPAREVAVHNLEAQRSPPNSGRDLVPRRAEPQISPKAKHDLRLDPRRDKPLQCNHGRVEHSRVVDGRPERAVQAESRPDALVRKPKLESDPIVA